MPEHKEQNQIIGVIRPEQGSMVISLVEINKINPFGVIYVADGKVWGPVSDKYGIQYVLPGMDNIVKPK